MAGCESWVRRLPLRSDQISVLSANVHSVCALEPGAVVDDSHITSMRTIVAMIAPSLRINWRVFRTIRFGNGSWGGWPKVLKSVTSEGMEMPVSKPANLKKSGLRFPRDGIAIGGFIAERYPSGRLNQGILTLTPFLDMELASIDPSMLRPQRKLVYQLDSLDPKLLTKDVPHAQGFIVAYRSLPIWKSEDRMRV